MRRDRSDVAAKRARLNMWIEELGRRRAPDLVVYGLAAYATITGLILAFFPREPWIGPPYTKALELASPEVWGGLMFISGLATALAFWFDGPSARLPALSLCGVYAALGYLLSIDPYVGDSGSPTAAPAYIFAAWIAVLAVLICGGKRS